MRLRGDPSAILLTCSEKKLHYNRAIYEAFEVKRSVAIKIRRLPNILRIYDGIYWSVKYINIYRRSISHCVLEIRPYYFTVSREENKPIHV